MTEPDKNHQSYFVPGLHRGLRVLEVVGESEKPLTISEIGRLIGVSRSSAFRLIYTLKHMGFLRGVYDDRAFELGPRILNLGFSYLSGQAIVQVARPYLEKLRDETQVSSHLAVLERRDVLYLDCLPSRTPFVSNIATGTRRPAYGTGLGWLLLGGLDSEKLAELYAGVEIPARTKHTPISFDALAERVAAVKAQGYVVSRGFSEPGGSSVNAAVRDLTGNVVAAIDVSGPDVGFELDRLESFYLPAVRAAAEAISADLGYRR